MVGVDLKQLEKMLDVNPDDATIRLACADALEEAGRINESLFQRLLVKLGIWPQPRETYADPHRWFYFSVSTNKHSEFGNLAYCIPGVNKFNTRSEAEEAIMPTILGCDIETMEGLINGSIKFGDVPVRVCDAE